MINKVAHKYVSLNSIKNINKILVKMNSETKYASNGSSFESSFVKKLSLVGDKVELIDGRNFIKVANAKEQTKAETLFTMGKIQLVINNRTGQIVDYRKPFYKTWKSINEKLSKYVDILLQNYDNKSVVKKHKLSVSGFTKKGFERLEQLKSKVSL